MAKVHHVGLTPRDAASEFTRWRLPAQVDLKEWDDEFVVRVGSSGATYLLSALAGATLQAMQAGAVYADDIAARVFAGAAPPSAATRALAAQFADRDADAEQVLNVLGEFESLGIARADRS
jgi:hypothetical protein